MSDLAGQTALVTGGAKRIGRAIVERLAAAGAGVVVHHHTSAAEAKQLVSALRKQGHAAWAVKADLAGAGLDRVVAQAAKAATTPITLLVNNASTFPAAKLGELTWDALAASLRTDAWAPLALTRQLAKQLPADRQGAVVNLLDTRIADYDWDHVGYWLAKRTLADLTRVCAVEYAPRLAINAVAPGPVLGPEGDPGFPQRLAKHLPMRRTATPAEVAEAVVHLLGSRATTGEVLHVDGGRHLGRATYGEGSSTR